MGGCVSRNEGGGRLRSSYAKVFANKGSRQQYAQLEEVVAPLLQLAASARFGQQLCSHIYDVLVRFASKVLQDRHMFQEHLHSLSTLVWGLEDLLETFSGRGWLLSTQYMDSLLPVVEPRLQELDAMLAAAHVQFTTQDMERRRAGMDQLQQLAVIIQQLGGLKKAVYHAGAPMASAQLDKLISALLPVLRLLPDETEDSLSEEIRQEAQLAAVTLHQGPYSVLRHIELRIFWYCTGCGEEVRWILLWERLRQWLHSGRSFSEHVGDLEVVQGVLASAEQRRTLELAIKCGGASSMVSVVELDHAFHPDVSLSDSLAWLLRYKEPHLSRSSQGVLPSTTPTPLQLPQNINVSSLVSPQPQAATPGPHVHSRNAVSPRDMAQIAHKHPAHDRQYRESLGGGGAVDGEGLPISPQGTVELVGREQQLSQLVTQMSLAAVRMLVLHGAQGVGKSALASSVSSRLLARGRWSRARCVDLRDVGTLDEAAMMMCYALDVPHHAVDLTACQRLRLWLQRHGKRMAIQGLVLENVDQAASDTAAQRQTRCASTSGNCETSLLALLLELQSLAPRLQLVLTCQQLPLQLATAAAAAGQGPGGQWILTSQVLPLDEVSAAAVLSMHAAQVVPMPQAACIVQACHCLPSMLRLAGCSLRQHVSSMEDLAVAAQECLERGPDILPSPVALSSPGHGMQGAGPVHIPKQAGEGGPAPPGTSTSPSSQPAVAWLPYHAYLVQKSCQTLVPEQQQTLRVLACLGTSLSEAEVELLLQQRLGNPCRRRSALCALYDLGLMHFPDLSQRHEMDTAVGAVVRMMLEQGKGPLTGSSPAAAGGKADQGTRGNRGLDDEAQWLIATCSQRLEEAEAMMRDGHLASMIRFYDHEHQLINQGMRVAGLLVLRGGPDCQAARPYADMLCRHLNTLCRFTLVPEQQRQLAWQLYQVANDKFSGQQQTGHIIAAAQALAHSGSVQDAELLLAEAQEATPGHDSNGSASHHPWQLPQVSMLLAQAEVLEAGNRLKDAEQMLAKYVSVLEPHQHQAAMDYGLAQMKRGDILLKLEQPVDAAAAAYRSAHAALRRECGEASWRTAQADLKCASCMRLQGSLQEAQRITEQCMRVQEGIQGKFNLDMAEGHSQLGQLAAASGQASQAVPHYLRSLHIMLELYGHKQRKVAQVMLLLADALQRSGRQQGADRVQQHAKQLQGVPQQGGAQPVVKRSVSMSPRQRRSSISTGIALTSGGSVAELTLESTEVLLASIASGTEAALVHEPAGAATAAGVAAPPAHAAKAGAASAGHGAAASSEITHFDSSRGLPTTQGTKEQTHSAPDAPQQAVAARLHNRDGSSSTAGHQTATKGIQDINQPPGRPAPVIAAAGAGTGGPVPAAFPAEPSTIGPGPACTNEGMRSQWHDSGNKSATTDQHLGTSHLSGMPTETTPAAATKAASGSTKGGMQGLQPFPTLDDSTALTIQSGGVGTVSADSAGHGAADGSDTPSTPEAGVARSSISRTAQAMLVTRLPSSSSLRRPPSITGTTAGGAASSRPSSSTGTTATGTARSRPPSITGTTATGTARSRPPSITGTTATGTARSRPPSITGTTATGAASSRPPSITGTTAAGTANSRIPSITGTTANGTASSRPPAGAAAPSAAPSRSSRNTPSRSLRPPRQDSSGRDHMDSVSAAVMGHTGATPVEALTPPAVHVHAQYTADDGKQVDTHSDGSARSAAQVSNTKPSCTHAPHKHENITHERTAASTTDTVQQDAQQAGNALLLSQLDSSPSRNRRSTSESGHLPMRDSTAALAADTAGGSRYSAAHLDNQDLAPIKSVMLSTSPPGAIGPGSLHFRRPAHRNSDPSSLQSGFKGSREAAVQSRPMLSSETSLTIEDFLRSLPPGFRKSQSKEDSSAVEAAPGRGSLRRSVSEGPAQMGLAHDESGIVLREHCNDSSQKWQEQEGEQGLAAHSCVNKLDASAAGHAVQAAGDGMAQHVSSHQFLGSGYVEATHVHDAGPSLDIHAPYLSSSSVHHQPSYDQLALFDDHLVGSSSAGAAAAADGVHVPVFQSATTTIVGRGMLERSVLRTLSGGGIAPDPVQSTLGLGGGADAGQLEPRIIQTLAQDEGRMAAGGIPRVRAKAGVEQVQPTIRSGLHPATSSSPSRTKTLHSPTQPSSVTATATVTNKAAAGPASPTSPAGIAGRYRRPPTATTTTSSASFTTQRASSTPLNISTKVQGKLLPRGTSALPRPTQASFSTSRASAANRHFTSSTSNIPTAAVTIGARINMKAHLPSPAPASATTLPQGSSITTTSHTISTLASQQHAATAPLLPKDHASPLGESVEAHFSNALYQAGLNPEFSYSSPLAVTSLKPGSACFDYDCGQAARPDGSSSSSQVSMEPASGSSSESVVVRAPQPALANKLRGLTAAASCVMGGGLGDDTEPGSCKMNPLFSASGRYTADSLDSPRGGGGVPPALCTVTETATEHD